MARYTIRAHKNWWWDRQLERIKIDGEKQLEHIKIDGEKQLEHI